MENYNDSKKACSSFLIVAVMKGQTQPELLRKKAAEEAARKKVTMEAVHCAKRAAREARRMATREDVRETKKTNRTSEIIGQLESLF